MSLKQKLQLYKKQLHEAQNKESGVKETATVAADHQTDAEIVGTAHDLGAEIRRLDDEYVFVRESVLPLSYLIGPYKAKMLFETVRAWQSEKPSAHPLSAFGLRTEDLIFFDTETTGLASGTGQMIFLIGVARLTVEGIRISQYFLPGPGHEAAFYNAFLRDVRSLKNLVTFNGKAFDWPRVKTRHRFVRDQVPRLPAFGHFDLLHASRRLWKGRLESVRLQRVEKDILGVNRGEDTPGKMAPFLYFKFLKQPDAGLIRGIMEHNREDVLSLIALYIHLSGKVLGRIPCDASEQFEIARWYAQLGEEATALRLFEKLTGQNSAMGRQARFFAGKLYKKEGRYAEALAMFHEMIEQQPAEEEACVEAAKLMEHQYKNYEEALQYTLRAIRCLRVKTPSDRSLVHRKREYIRRANRLDEKLFRSRH